MKIPDTLLIGGTTFKVIVTDAWEDSAEVDGECVFNSTVGNVLYIKDTLSEDAKAITLIHESMHAMNSTINHEFLDSLAQQIYAFLKLNKLDFS